MRIIGNLKFLHLIFVILILILSNFSITIFAEKNLQNHLLKNKKSIYENNNLNNNYEYIPIKITPENATYHPSNEKFTIEWWYFEGIFENGYNAIVNVILISKKNIGFCITHLNIFHNTINEFFSNRKIQSIQKFEATKNFPNIFLDDKQIINFNQNKYNDSKKWVYNLNFELDGNEVDLEFEGLTPGWEGNTLDGRYGPVLPIADVKGFIKLNGNVINVSGLGYHEHAYNISLPIIQWGWYWGKIVGNDSSLFWGKMYNTRWNEQGRAGVFSIKNSSFINIRPENIDIKLKEYEFYNKNLVPTKIIINISDEINKIFINTTIKVIKIFHLPFGIIDYWRYLVLINGKISYNGFIEEINNKTQIMEIMRFR